MANSDWLLVLPCILSVHVARSSHTLLSAHLYLDINKLNVPKSFKFVITHLFPGSLFPSLYNRIQTYAADDKSVRQWKTTSLNKKNNYKLIIVHHKWPIKHLTCFFKKKTFWLPACLGWVAVGTWLLIKEIKILKTTKSFRQVNLSQKSQNFFQNSVHNWWKTFLLFLIKIASSFNWALKRPWELVETWTLIRNFAPTTVCFLRLDVCLNPGTESVI